MTILQVSAKMDLRLNKGASGDYDNLWSYVKEEAFSKAINEWVRKQVHGKNITQEGDEETSMRVDDLQVLLKLESLKVKDKGNFSQSERLPSDYLYMKRVTPIVTKGYCNSVRMRSYLKEEGNVDILTSLPSFDFEETFHTVMNNRVNVYHNKDFKILNAELTYYRKPKAYSFKKLNSVVEFKDDICELLVDEACTIIAADIQDLNARALIEERKEKAN